MVTTLYQKGDCLPGLALNKIRRLDADSCGVTMPKGDLQVEGVIDADGELTGQHRIHIRHVAGGEWKLELVEEIGEK